MIDFDFAETTLVGTRVLSEIGSFNINNVDAQKSLILTRVSLFDLGAIDTTHIEDENYEYYMSYAMKTADMINETPIATGNVDECINLSTAVYDDPSGQSTVNALTAIGIGATLDLEDVGTATIASPLFAIFGRVKTRNAGTETLGDELTLCSAVQVNRNVVFGYGIASKLRFLMHWNNTLFRRPNGVEVVAEYKSQYLSTQTFQSWLDKYNLNSRLDYDYVKRNVAMYAGVYESAQEAMTMSVDGNQFRLRSAQYSRLLKSKTLLSHKDVRGALSTMTSALDNGDYAEVCPQFNYYEYIFALKVLEDANGNVCLACFSNPLVTNHLKCGSLVAYKNCKLLTLPSGSGSPVIRDLPTATFEITNDDDGSYEWKNLYLPRECLVGGITKEGMTFTIMGLDVDYSGTSGSWYYKPTMLCVKYSNVFSSVNVNVSDMYDSSQSYYGDWFAYSAAHNNGESLFWLAHNTPSGLMFKEAKLDGSVNDYIIKAPQSDAWKTLTVFGCRIVVNGILYPAIVTRTNVDVFEVARLRATTTWGNQYELNRSPLSGLFNYEFEIPETRNVIGCQTSGSDICIQQLDITETQVNNPYYFTVITSNGTATELGQIEEIDNALANTCKGQTTLQQFGMIGIGNGGSMLGVSTSEIGYSGAGATLTVNVRTVYYTFTIRSQEYIDIRGNAFATKNAYNLRYKFNFNSQSNTAQIISLTTNGDLEVSAYYHTYFDYEKIGGSIVPI